MSLLVTPAPTSLPPRSPQPLGAPPPRPLLQDLNFGWRSKHRSEEWTTQPLWSYTTCVGWGIICEPRPPSSWKQSFPIWLHPHIQHANFCCWPENESIDAHAPVSLWPNKCRVGTLWLPLLSSCMGQDCVMFCWIREVVNVSLLNEDVITLSFTMLSSIFLDLANTWTIVSDTSLIRVVSRTLLCKSLSRIWYHYSTACDSVTPWESEIKRCIQLYAFWRLSSIFHSNCWRFLNLKSSSSGSSSSTSWKIPQSG